VNFSKYVKGNTLVVSNITIDASKLVSFLQNKPNITSLSLTGCDIGDQCITELTKFKGLALLALSQMYINGERAKE
jgi:hypothetical protein